MVKGPEDEHEPSHDGRLQSNLESLLEARDVAGGQRLDRVAGSRN